MVCKDFVIKNKPGIHMRPAQVLAGEMNKFSSTVTIRFSGKNINDKSMMLSQMNEMIEAGDRRILGNTLLDFANKNLSAY